MMAGASASVGSPGIAGGGSGTRRAATALVRAGMVCTISGALIIGVLHLVPPTAAISPLRRTISEYGLTDLAWAFNAGVLALAAGSAAILAAVVLSRLGGPAGLVAGGLWVLGLLTVVAFPKHNWAVGPSVSGQVHRMGSLVAFIALPLTVLALTARRRRGGSAGAGTARWAFGLALVSLAWFLPILVAIGSAGRGGAWWLVIPLGLVERGMAVTEVAALIVLGGWCLRAGGRAAIPHRPAIPVTDVVPAAVTGDLAGPVTDPVVP